MELQDKQKRVVLTGNVDITQEDLRLQAARTTLAYTDAQTVQVQRIDAAGGVVVTRGDQRASGNSAVYDIPRRIITMVGNVALRRGKDTLNGGRLVIDLNTGLSSVDGRSGGAASGAGGTTTTPSGRVTGTFNVAKKST
jgi:lipopolysaccharide export system protein LptA